MIDIIKRKRKIHLNVRVGFYKGELNESNKRKVYERKGFQKTIKMYKSNYEIIK